MSHKSTIDRIQAQAKKQIEGLERRSDLEVVLTTPLDEVVKAYEALRKAQEGRLELQKAAEAATQDVRQCIFNLRAAVQGNIKAAARRLGKYSPELTVLGGKPRRGGRYEVTPDSETTDDSEK